MGDLPKLDDLPPLGFTERELFSIYLKYSEIDFDADEIENNVAGVHSKQEDPANTINDHHSPEQKISESVDSSPASHNDHDHDHDSSRMTCSTTHTTPLKHLMMRPEGRRTEYAQFLADLEASDLPANVAAYLKSLASQTVEIGGHLQHYQDQENKEKAEDLIFEEAGELIQLLESSVQNCSGQVANAEWVKELAVFTFVPTDVALWSNYRQRVELVTRHLAVPSAAEYRLLESLVSVYDAYVHYPFVQLSETKIQPATPTYPEVVRSCVADLSTAMHSLVTTYKHWLQASYHFRTTYMAPLMRRIQDSPWVRREIEQSEVTIEMARLSLHKRYESGEMKRILQEDQLRGAEMLAERRSKSSVLPGQLGGKIGMHEESGSGKGKGKGKGRTRARREHTM